MSSPFSKTQIKSNIDIKKFCKKHNLPYHEQDLDQLENDKVPGYAFVFTGQEKDEYNGGYPHHWLFLAGDYLFDSYSYQEDYKLPSYIKPLQLEPKRLQEYGSNVCGEYCMVFYYYAHKIAKDINSQIGIDFCNYYGFGADQSENDKKIINLYNSI